jgi:hypothetical protein
LFILLSVCKNCQTTALVRVSSLFLAIFDAIDRAWLIVDLALAEPNIIRV